MLTDIATRPSRLILRALLPGIESAKLIRGVRLITVVGILAPAFLLGVALFFLRPSIFVPTGPTDFWTMIAGVAAVLALGIAVGVGMVAWYGLRSIRLARQDMVIRATREARAMAIARAEYFSAEIIRGAHRTLQEELTAAKITPFTHDMKSGLAIFDEPNIIPRARAWWQTVPPVTRSRILYFLNDLEAWSMYFTKELAESDVVFEPCGPTYCSIVLQYSPWIILARKDEYKGFYHNIVTLFKAWRAELDAREGGSTTEAALRAARAAEERRAQNPLPKALGTKVDI